MAYAGAGVDVVVTEAGAHEFLHDEDLFVGATRRRDAADRLAAVSFLDIPESVGRKANRFVPLDLAPWFGRLVANQRFQDAIPVRGIAPGEAALDAGVAVIGLAVFPWRHAHDLVAFHLRLERAANAAVGAGRYDLVIRQSVFDHAFLHERGRRAGLHAGAAGHALGVEEALAHAGRHLGREAAAFDRQGKGALDFVAGPDAT